MALVTVTADFQRADGTPAEGWLYMWPHLDAVLLTPDPTLVTRARDEQPLDVTGTATVHVLPSDDPEWQATGPIPYVAKWAVSGSYGERIIVVPAPGPWSLWELVDLEDPSVIPTPIPGPAGPPGADSDVPGPPGPPGAQGPVGPAGEGVPGPPGETGAQGPAGPQGSTGEGIRILGEVPTVGDLPATGNDPGDAYIVTADGNLHVWTDDTTPASWLDAGQVVGPQGPVGPQGVQGPQGPVGPSGTGLQGPQGIQGIPGDPGPAGATGDTGPTGPPGTAYLSAAWNFNQNTVVSPASGTMRMNATTYAATTTLWVHETDRDGLDRSIGLSVGVAGDQIIMQSAQGRAVWNITAQADSGVYRTFTVTLAESSGSRPSASSPTTLYFASAGTPVKEIQDEGTTLTNRAKVNFVGAGVTAADDAGNGRTVVTIPGLQARATATKTTASLAAGASESGTITLAPGYRLYTITTSAPARARLYTTTAKRDADAPRAIGTNPTGDHGLVLEFVSTAGLLAADLSPVVDGFNGKGTPDGAIPYSVTNTGTAAAAITCTFNWIRSE